MAIFNLCGSSYTIKIFYANWFYAVSFSSCAIYVNLFYAIPNCMLFMGIECKSILSRTPICKSIRFMQLFQCRITKIIWIMQFYDILNHINHIKFHNLHNDTNANLCCSTLSYAFYAVLVFCKFKIVCNSWNWVCKLILPQNHINCICNYMLFYGIYKVSTNLLRKLSTLSF